MTKMDDKFIIPDSILSDLCSRFIINVPEEERNDLIRIFFQIEIAHWFYLDFYCESSFSSSSSSGSSSSSSSSSSDENNNESHLVPQQQQSQHSRHNLKPCSIRTFAENIFRHCPFLTQHTNQLDDILSKWKVFKHAVPTNGAIIIDETMKYVLLVQGFWAKASWGFPKGKVFEEETEAKCAIREVLEETGYDISQQLKEDEYLEININDQTIRLYLITNVPKSTKFEPRTRREIKEVRWFAIDELPVHRRDNRSKHSLGYSPNSFFMVIPFVKQLKQWIGLKNGSLSGQLSNVINNHKKQRQHSSQNHRRRNSNSHSHHHHHHNHHQNHNNHNNNNNQQQQQHNFKSNQTPPNYKAVSKSNENLSTSINTSPSNQQFQPIKQLNTSTTNSAGSQKKFNKNNSNNNNNNNNNNNINNNAFLKHFSNGFNQYKENLSLSGNGMFNITPVNSSSIINPETEVNKSAPPSFKSQSQFYQKLQQNEFADLLNIKDSTKRSNNNIINNNKLQHNSNSKFKPVNCNNNNNNNSNNKLKSNNSTPQVTESAFQSGGIKKQTLDHNIAKLIDASSAEIKMSNSVNELFNSILNDEKQQQQFGFNKVKKHLDFNGPECWINFKFDYDSIAQSLPPVFEL